jgi:hypothetical protein
MSHGWCVCVCVCVCHNLCVCVCKYLMEILHGLLWRNFDVATGCCSADQLCINAWIMMPMSLHTLVLSISLLLPANAMIRTYPACIGLPQHWLRQAFF